MAEFKLGRIKFVYQGTWTTGTGYVVDDVVTNGGKTYICVVSHTASTLFTTDLTAAIPCWNLIADGTKWRNTWSATTYYNLGDMVLWGAVVYICKTAHTSQTYLEDDQSKWDTFAASFNWKGAWATSTRYKVRDLVYYGGVTYVCNTYHTSAATASLGLENDISNWDTFNSGLNYVGQWSNGSIRYKLNDVVKYGADLWICTQGHTSSGITGIDNSKFSLFVAGFEFLNSWSASNNYVVGDVVTYGGYTYTAIQNSTSTSPQTPSTANTYWQVFTSGLIYSGAWTSGTSYLIGNVVSLGGYTYVATADNSGSQPPSANWSRLNSGLRWNAAPNTTYSGVSGTNLTGTGTSATFDITLKGTSYSAIIHSGSAGTGYAVNNTIKVLGTSLGGISPANDVTLTVASITGGGGTGPIATVTVSAGYAVTWKSGITYVTGDAVYFGNSTYICISAHIGASGNRPDADSNGTYWNILASGADSGALTTQGDMVYFGTNGATRLPIGTDGQVLRVNNNTPAWSYYGLLNNIVYVASNGVDVAGNGQGLTMDKPWASLLFACKQIEDGYLNTNAGLLLTLNKQFMMKEVNNYILNKYSYSVTASTNSGSKFTTSSTSGMYAGMPITFSASTSNAIAGTIYYVAGGFTSTQFSISTSYANATAGSPTLFALTTVATITGITANFSYTQSKAERDTGTILDAVIFDLTHGGNLYVTTATQSFFSTLTSYITTNTTYEVSVWVDSLRYLENTLFTAVLTNVAPANNYQASNGISAGNRAIQNTTGVATSAVESGALTTAKNLLDIIPTALAAGSYANIPQLQRPHTSIYVKTGTYNEYGPIVVPLDTAIIGDELRSTIVQAGNPRPYLANDAAKTVAGWQRVQSVLTNLISNSTVTPTSTGPFPNTATQVTNLPAGDVGSSTAVTNVLNNTRILQDALSGGGNISGPTNSFYPNGVVHVPAFSLPTVTGYNTSYLAGFGDGVTQIKNNYAFIHDEIANFLINGSYNWASYGSTNQAETFRDLSSVLDALQYDMTYGCNDQSMIVGRSYFSLNLPLLYSPYLQAVKDSLGRLYNIIGQIVQKQAVSANSTNTGYTQTQVLSGTGGSPAAGAFAQARIQDILNWINLTVQDTSAATFTGSISSTTLTVSAVTGTIKIGQIVTGGTVAAGTYITAGSGTSWTVSVSQTATATGSTITIDPVTSGAAALAPAAQLAAFNAIQAQRALIANDAQGWVTKFYQNESPSLTLTNRDAGLVVDALSYDVLFNSNFYSIISGRAFNRLITSVNNLQTKFADATYGALGFIGQKVKTIAASGSVVQLTGVIDDAIAQLRGQPTTTAVFNGSITGTQLVVNSVTSGTVAIGMTLSGTGIVSGTTIISGSGSNWLLNYNQNASSTTTAITTVTPTTNLLTLGTTAGMVPGLQIVITGTAISNLTAGTYYISQVLSATQLSISSSYLGSTFTINPTNTLSGVVITGSNGQFTCNPTTSTLAVGQPVTISGTIGGTGSINTTTGVYSSTTTTYFIIATNGSTTFTLSPTVGGTAAVTSAGTLTGLTYTVGATGAMTAVVTGIYGGLALTTTITASSNIIPVTTLTTSTNLITVSSNAGMYVNMPIVFSSLPANGTTTATATTASGTLITVATTTGMVVGQKIWFSGLTFGGVVANTIYYIASIPTPGAGGTITISTTFGGGAFAVTTGSGSMTVTYNKAGGLVNGNVYWINSVTAGTYPAAGTTITVTSSYKSGTAHVITNNVTGITAGATAGVPLTQGIYAQGVNGTAQPWGNPIPYGTTGSYAAYSGYNNTLTTIQGAEIIRANKAFLANEMVAYIESTFGGTVTTTATNGTVTTSSAHSLTVGDPIVFSGTSFDASIVVGTVYWVLTTPTTTTFTMSSTSPGTGTQSTVSLTSGTGTMTVAYYVNTAKCLRDTQYFLDALVYDLGLTGNYKTTRYTQVYLSSINGLSNVDVFRLRNGTGVRNLTMNGLQGSLSVPNSYGTRRPTSGSYVSFDPGFGPNDSNVWISNRSPYTQNMTNFGNGCVGMKLDAALHSGGQRSMVSNDFTQVLSDGIGVYCTGHGAITEAVSVFCYYGYSGYLAEFGGRIRATNGNSSYGTYGVIAEGIDSYETPIYATLNNRANQAYITNTVTDAKDQILRIEFENAGSGYTNAVPTINGAGYNAVAVQDEFRDSAVFETRLVDLNNGQGVGGSNYLTSANVAQVSSTVGSIQLANTDTQLSSSYPGMKIQLTAGTGVGQYANILSYNNGNKTAQIYRPSFATLTITVNSTTLFTVASTATLYAGMPIMLGAAIAGLTAGTVYYVSATSFSTTQFRVADTAAHATGGGGDIALTATSATPAVMNSSTIVGTTLTVGTLASGTIYVGMLLSGGNVAANTYISANIGGSGSGSTWTVTQTQQLGSTNLTGTISVGVYAAGWDHVVPGSTISNSIDLTTGYIIEPAIAYSSPGFKSTAQTLTGSGNTWAGLTYGAGNFVATATGAAVTSYSTNGKSWNIGGALPSSTTWSNVVYGGGQGATGTAVVGGLGGSGAVLTAIIGTGASAGQVIGVTVVNGGYNYTTPPTIVINPVGAGSGATATCQVLNGAITIVTMTITGSGYTSGATVSVVTSEVSSITANTWGQNYFGISANAPVVTITAPFSATAWTSSGSATSGTYYSAVDTGVTPNVTNYYLAGASGTFSSTKPTFTNSVYGKSAPTGTGIGASGTYGVALTYVGTLAVASANLTNTGISSFNLTQAGYGYSTTPTITITDPQSAFVAISSATNAAAYQVPTALTSAWISTSSNTGLTNLNSLAYGNNLFIAVGGTTTSPSCASLLGNPSNTSWVNQSSNIKGAVTYGSIAYGNGTFVAIASSGTATTWMNADPTNWKVGGTLSSSTTWVGIAYGNGRFVALAQNGTVNYSIDKGVTFAATLNDPLTSITTWKNIKYGAGLFIAIATSSQTVATSPDGLNWTLYTSTAGMPSSSNWTGLAFGNPQNATLGAVPTWAAVSATSGTTAASIATGATPQGRIKIVANAINEVRMIEPGSGFPRGNVTATATTSTGTITVDDITNLVANQPIVFNGTSAGGITTGTYYFVYGTPTPTSGVAGTIQISYTAGGSIVPLSAATITSMTYFASPIITQTDPNKVNTAALVARIGNGALGNPSFSNRGTANTTATSSMLGDGYADLYQTGTYINVSGLYSQPTAGANVTFSTIPNTWYKLVQVTNLLGTPGNYTATFQINPGLTTLLAPPNGTQITTNLLYSNVRLTGHDFLYIGTGGFTATNYPSVDPTKAVQANQTYPTGGGRVFFTSTDQDGNFNVGNLFGVQQSTGTASLNASAFNLAGLNSLTLGSVNLGVGSATITQFSTDPYFTANSDSIVPTQKAIKAFITAQIGGGASTLNVNTITAGQILISGNTISNTTGNQIYVSSKMYFTGGVDGAPVALIFFAQR